ncbi:MAG: hypothetical protein V1850_04670 [Candidatus Bathyarchaeota archaeon]
MAVVKKLQDEPIDEFLNLIDDSNWHSLSSITFEGSVEVAHFLEKYGFIKIDEFNEKVRINQKLRELPYMVKVKGKEKKRKKEIDHFRL